MSGKVVITLFLSLSLLALIYLSYEAFTKHNDTVNSQEKADKKESEKENKRVNVIVLLPNPKPLDKSELDPRPRFPFSDSPLLNNQLTVKSENRKEDLFRQPRQENSKPEDLFQRRRPDILFNKTMTFSPFPSHVDHGIGETN